MGESRSGSSSDDVVVVATPVFPLSRWGGARHVVYKKKFGEISQSQTQNGIKKLKSVVLVTVKVLLGT